MAPERECLQEDTHLNAGNLALDNIDQFGEYSIFDWQGEAISNVELDTRARRLATVLRGRGVVAGDRVAVMMPNGPDVFEAFQAVWKIGAVILPVMPQLGSKEVAHMLANSEARAVVTTGQLAPLIHEAAPQLELLFTTTDPGPTQAIELQRETAGAEPLAAMTDRRSDDLALLLYTSGTTGRPKGVMLSHEVWSRFRIPRSSTCRPSCRLSTFCLCRTRSAS
jgi:long-chain acyl-CoA synthetase